MNRDRSRPRLRTVEIIVERQELQEQAMKKITKKKVRIFEEMKQSLNDALRFEQGKKLPLRITERYLMPK